ncbi:helix-turn-helix domain-containing protein [Halalkalibacter nanhaiisediminis]|uniref:HTH-type biofilm formation transcriptional regulator n=1 Tax=Halalkalibacter nanhaiisediminis TaxID=688079 RepID=A0A562QMY0_9BACI|nr:helix-turn-helix transcriptional regulator [Halalkalibacter nanhaiisediminis]TWI58121.1 HTH-type biofilm formation transcriptional regulator [Halalkalibacter nanhaiisediminis]
MNGGIIRALRQKRGMTLNQLAVISGVSKSYISYIERGLQKNPSIIVLKKISEALDIEFLQLVESLNRPNDHE